MEPHLLLEVSRRYGTPCYVYFEDRIKENFERLRRAFCSLYPKTQIAYSIKNCFIPQIISILEKYTPLYEVTSLGEMLLLQRMGIGLNRCIFTNIYKPLSALRFAIHHDLALFAIDSLSDLQSVRHAAEVLQKQISVLIRVNPAFDIRDTVFASAVPWSKTGVEMCAGHVDCAEDLLLKATETDAFTVAGIHGHLGSQVISLEYYEKFAKSLTEFFSYAQTELTVPLKMIDFGGGYPISYGSNYKQVPTIRDIASTIVQCVQGLTPTPSLVIESGRYITGDAGILLTKVVTIKHSPHIGKIAVIDASMYNHLLDAVLVDWYFEVVKLGTIHNSLEEVHIVGMTNDSLDHLDPPKEAVCPGCGRPLKRPRKRLLPKLKEGDILVIKGAGAYTTCFNNNYCLLPLPAVVLVTTAGEIKLIRQAQTELGIVTSLLD